MTAYNLQNLNVLVVDDNRHMRTLIRTVLNALGCWNIHEASDGADALKEMEIFPADVVFCDLVMTPFDGIEFTRMVRTAKDSPNPYVPIIMLTGHTEMARVVEARDAGVDEFVAKPVSPKTLYARLVAVIEHRRPFIRTKNYFGPDRRRREDPDYKGPFRRSTDPQNQNVAAIPADGELTPEQVDALMNS